MKRLGLVLFVGVLSLAGLAQAQTSYNCLPGVSCSSSSETLTKTTGAALTFSGDAGVLFNDGSSTNSMAPISASYTMHTLQSFNNQTTIVLNYDSKNWDTNNAVTTGAAWKFTAPVTGYYQVNAIIALGQLTNTFNDGSLSAYVNGTSQAIFVRPSWKAGATNALYVMSGGLVVKMTAGDYLQIELYQDSGGPRSVIEADTYSVTIALVR